MTCEPRHENKCSIHAKEGKEKSTPEYVPSERDWTEDFEHENGKYFCVCGQCKNIFIGHKRRVRCKLCGYGSNPKTAVKPDFAKLAEGAWNNTTSQRTDYDAQTKDIVKTSLSDFYDTYVVPLLKENEMLLERSKSREQDVVEAADEIRYEKEWVAYYKELIDKADKVIEASENLMAKGILDEIANVYHSRSLKEYQALKAKKP